ncbi:OmpA/MotB domain protein [Pseudodesulfovibrio mercurii]|uniref:OmpA/MotB domain protein n=1 Tax=Pseudodesulfovibrio mercurii TaxID=641491 RepID=F0JJM2_9BACT|nr:OmpA family protein [Pseudodesulfovibrio mercurii]EGB16121.1 OmpA/MotB domain protein [Pseudodesulfovibrio mercurii]
MFRKFCIGVCLAFAAVALAGVALAGEVIDSDTLVRQLEDGGSGGMRTRGFTVNKAAAETPRPSATVYIYFATNSAVITGEQSFRQLDELGRALTSSALRGARMEIGGHTDSVGSDAYNLQLSRKRAQAVSDYLNKKYGFTAAAVTGYGESAPVASNETAEGRAGNRRVVITRLD